jgi:hypothetical protein
MRKLVRDATRRQTGSGRPVRVIPAVLLGIEPHRSESRLARWAHKHWFRSLTVAARFTYVKSDFLIFDYRCSTCVLLIADLPSLVPPG